MLKKCQKCQLEKSISEFNKNKTRKDGRQSLCRSCDRERAKTNYSNPNGKYLKTTLINRKIRKEKLWKNINWPEKISCSL